MSDINEGFLFPRKVIFTHLGGEKDQTLHNIRNLLFIYKS